MVFYVNLPFVVFQLPVNSVAQHKDLPFSLFMSVTLLLALCPQKRKITVSSYCSLPLHLQGAVGSRVHVLFHKDFFSHHWDSRPWPDSQHGVWLSAAGASEESPWLRSDNPTLQPCSRQCNLRHPRADGEKMNHRDNGRWVFFLSSHLLCAWKLDLTFAAGSTRQLSSWQHWLHSHNMAHNESFMQL